MPDENPREHISQIRRTKFLVADDGGKLNENPLERDLRNSLQRLATDLYSKDHHFILELIQNAEDNDYADGDDAKLVFELQPDDPTHTPGTEGCLCVLNNEVGFQPKHVVSICSVGDSTKNKRDGYIGEKGIGFKSVFVVSSRPHVFSNGYRFHFRTDDCEAGLGYIVPHWWNDEVPECVEKNGTTTCILLPLLSGKAAAIAAQLRTIEPESILFLNKLSALHISIPGENFKRTVEREGKDGSVCLSADGATRRYFTHHKRWLCPESLVEPQRIGVEEREVTVALPLTGNDRCDGRVFAFLPTEVRTGLPFIINADFLLTANREDIHDTPDWNKQLVRFCAEVFVEAFDALRQAQEHRAEAYRFIPTKDELARGAEFFTPLVESIHQALKERECILTTSDTFVRPSAAFLASEAAIRLLYQPTPPPRLAEFALVHVDLEPYRKRLKALDVRTLELSQLLQICNDLEWLQAQDLEWWVSLFEYLAKQPEKAEAFAGFPLLRCADGICRHPSDVKIFCEAEGQPTPASLPADWPVVHFFDRDLQKLLQQKPTVWTWLTGVTGLHAFSILLYFTGTGGLLNWMRRRTGAHGAEQLMAATRFVAINLKRTNPDVLRLLQRKMTWLLADGRVLGADADDGNKFITPECLEGPDGWNSLFVGPLDRQDFHLLADGYVSGLDESGIQEMREFFTASGVTNQPDPGRLERQERPTHSRDWICPQWLRDLTPETAKEHSATKIRALEKWLSKFKLDAVVRFLSLSERLTRENEWQETPTPSQFDDTLRCKPWLRTTKGILPPTYAFLDKPGIREFLGDTVPYVQAKLSEELLGRLGVRVQLTADVLISLLRDMSGAESPNLGLLEKIYRRLQDSSFNPDTFRREKLVFLSQPTPGWFSTNSLAWDDAGEVFDNDFGYVALTYGDSELHRFFTEKLHVPMQPDLERYASVWKSLCVTDHPDTGLVEKKMKLVLQRLSDQPDEFSNLVWWAEMKPHLTVWTARKRFVRPTHAYAPDHGVAAELFADYVAVAFPSKPTPQILGLLRGMGCRSLSENVQTRLVKIGGESNRLQDSLLTPAAKELSMLLLCSHPGWQKHKVHLENLFKTVEVDVEEILVEYSLKDSPEIQPPSRSQDAYWEPSERRLLRRQGVDMESSRAAAAKSIAATFFGENQSAEIRSKFFEILTVLPKRAQELKREQTNWRLSLEQEAWLRELGLTLIVIDFDESEQATSRRPAHSSARPPNGGPSSPTPVDNQSSSPRVGSNELQRSDPAEAAPPLDPSESAGMATAPGNTTATSGRQEVESDTPPELRSPDSAPARLVDVRGYLRSPPERAPRQPQRERQENREGGLKTTPTADRDALEQRGRDYTMVELKRQGYEVTPMDQTNPGYDLEARKVGEFLKVEVKAHAGGASIVIVTQREWEEYQKTHGRAGEKWELWNIENLANNSANQPTITPVRYIPESALKPNGYWVDLRQCSSDPPG